jgi:hypothetical protein
MASINHHGAKSAFAQGRFAFGWRKTMLKQAIMAIAAIGALSVASPADARHHSHTRVVISYGTPAYYGDPYRGYYSGYYHPYYDPYYHPRYRYRHEYYRDRDDYYRPRYRHWKKRHWRHHRHDHYDRYDRGDHYYRD